MTWAQQLSAATAQHGPVCVGIDPHPSLLTKWGLPEDVTGLREFSLRVVNAVGPHVAALKPQSAFFEMYGAAGIAVLEETLGRARELGVLTILDVKRGDIGSTMAGYASAYLRPGAPLEADAITLSPYLGFHSLDPAIEAACAAGKGLYVLALTSNPQGPQVQHAVQPGPEGRSVAADIIAQAGAINTEVAGEGEGLGPIGLVIGATIGSTITRLGINLAASKSSILAPGLGAQGAGPEAVQEVFGEAKSQVIASTSRAVLGAGPEEQALVEAAKTVAKELRQVL